MEIHQILNFLLAFIIFQQIQISVFGNLKLTGLMSLVAASWTFNFSLCSGVCYSLAQSHWISIRRQEDDCGKLGEGDAMLTGILTIVSGDACLLWILSELQKLFCVKLHVLCSNTRFWDPHDLHSSLQNHSEWSLPWTGRQDKWSVPKLFSRWCLSSEQHHHHFKCKAYNRCLPAWQTRPLELLACIHLPSCKMLPSVKTPSQASLK